LPDSLPDVPQDILDRVGDAVEGVEPTPAAPTNDSTATPAAPEGTSTEEAATAAPDSFTKLDPNALPPDVRPYYDSMLADYTRKTQEASPWRKLGEELGVESPEAIRDAAQLYAYLQDPNNLREFHAQLGSMLGGQPEPAATPVAPSPLDTPDLGLEDPALAAIRGELDAVKQALIQRDAQAQAEQVQWALLGEMNRQEALLKEAHPEWEPDGDEWTAIWEMAPAFNGDLTAAAQLVSQAQNAAVTRLLNSKTQVSNTEGLTPPAPVRSAETLPVVDGEDHELKDATARAREYLRQVANQSE